MNGNKKLLKKMNLQLFGQTYDPDNVTMYEHKDGTIPEKYNKLILKEIMNGSKVMQLAKYEEMDSKEKKFEYFAKGPGAYWVGEGEKIQTSKPQWMQATMVAKKLGVIVPCAREFLHYKMSDFFEQMKPKIAEAFYKKFDEAAILNVENPFPQSVEESALAAGNLISGGITTGVNYILYAALLALQLPLLAANSAAWAGAVLTAYALNRCLVFHSQKPVGNELASFAALRLVTLLAENALLWLLVIRLGAPAFPAKLLVSVITVVGNYVLCKFGIFRKETVSHG